MEEQKNKMGEKPVVSLLASMSLPMMLSMLAQSLYNIVDSMYVSWMGTEALTAVSLAYPLQNIVMAVSVGIGVGISSALSISLGEKNQEKANETATIGMALTLVHCVIFVLFGLVVTRPFLQLFTSSPQVLEDACDYTYIVLCVSFGSLLQISLEKIYQGIGAMKTTMILLATGCIINIILDPILIFGMFGLPKMGVAGAAAATIIGQMAACLLAFVLLQRQKEGLKLEFRRFQVRGVVIGNIYQVAVPSTMMTAMPSLLVSVLNGILSMMANAATAIAVLGLYFKMQSFVYMPANGVVQALRPIASYNYGAGRLDRLKKTVNCAMLVTGIIMAAGTLLFAGFPGAIMKLFDAQPELLEMGSSALRIISIGFFISTPSLIYSGTFEALGKGVHSLAISILRQMSILPILAFLLAKVMGTTGVWISFPVAEAVAVICAFALWKQTSRKMGIVK